MEAAQKIRPSWAGTILILISCVLGYISSFQDLPPSGMARVVSIILLIGIVGSFLLDWRHGLRNLIRVDVFALLSLYFLSYFEFLFPQSRFDLLVIPKDVVEATHLMLVGIAAMVIGRHLDVFPKKILDVVGAIEMRPRDFLVIYFGACFLNFLPMLMAVDFNPVTWFEETLNPRFRRAWGRGRYGNLATLVNELQMLGYVMPPLAGVIFARRKAYATVTLVFVGITLLLLWYSAFSSGTRNILAIQFAGFLIGFVVVQKQLRLKVLIPIGLAFALAFVLLADHMLAFRNMGLGTYVENGYYKAEYQEFEETYLGANNRSENESGYFVDYNLWRVAQMVEAFPERYPHIGWNLPFVAITKPIPRALWKNKPMDLKVGLEEVIGAEGYTIACTWVGEAFVAGGLPWIIGVGLLIGAFCRYWNHLANFMQSPFPLIVFASGFYAVLLLMRSLMFFTTALLPSIALVIMGLIIHRSRSAT